MSLIKYNAHCSDIGWLNPVEDNMVSGTVGQNRKLECFEITELNIPNSGVHAFAHVSGLGWSLGNGVGEHVGTTGQNRAIEAIYIGLTGEAYNSYDIWYRCHVQDYGWLDWSSNGQINGTIGGGKQVEAIQITIHSKNEYYDPRVQTDETFIDLTPHQTEAPIVTPTNKAEELLNQARSYIGYISGSDIHSIFGEGNWCCHFVRSCCNNVGIEFLQTAWVPDVEIWAKNTGRWVSVPQPGDVVLFDFGGGENGEPNGSPDHIGIVENVYGVADIDSIEGNTDGGNGFGVYRRVRQSDIYGYVRLI